MTQSIAVILPHFSINGVTKVALNELEYEDANFQIISLVKERSKIPPITKNLKVRYVTKSEILSRLAYPRYIDSLDITKIGVIIAHNNAGAIAAYRFYKKMRIPYIVYIHNADQIQIPGTLPKFEKGEIKESLKSAAVLLANSQISAIDLERIYGLKGATVLYPGCSPSSSTEIIKNKDDFYLVVHMIALSSTFDTLYRLLNRNKDIKLVIAGARKYSWQVVYSIFKIKFGRRANFIFDPDDEQLAQLYKRSRMLLHTGIETFGMSPLEAAGYGTPSVAVKGSGIFEVLEENKEIFSFESNNVDELNAIISLYSNDSIKLRGVAEKAWEKSHKFDWNIHRQQLFKKLTEL
jgi:glycosyltransferase involved in cell wall biosynthesis